MRSILVRVSDTRCVDVVGGNEIDVYESGGFIGVAVERPGKVPLLGGCDHSATMLGWCGKSDNPENQAAARGAIADLYRAYGSESVRTVDLRPYFRELTQEDKDTMEAARTAARNAERQGRDRPPVALFFDVGRTDLSEERLNALVGRKVAAVEVQAGSGGSGKLTLV